MFVTQKFILGNSLVPSASCVIGQEALGMRLTWEFLFVFIILYFSVQVFTNEETNDLVETITSLADLGFGMTARDIGELVQSFVEYNEHVRGKKTFHHRGRVGYPGPDWQEGFIKNNNLSAKQATTLSNARYQATKNPFVIYHY